MARVTRSVHVNPASRSMDVAFAAATARSPSWLDVSISQIFEKRTASRLPIATSEDGGQVRDHVAADVGEELLRPHSAHALFGEDHVHLVLDAIEPLRLVGCLVGIVVVGLALDVVLLAES